MAVSPDPCDPCFRLLCRPPPALHLCTAGPAGILAGLLWSSGNFAGILATRELGLALAWPLIQCQLLVSSAWGALYYREQRGVCQLGGMAGATACVVLGASLLMLGK